MQRSWLRRAGLIIILLCSGCEHFHAKTFITTPPWHYTDLGPGIHEDWERETWKETELALENEFPKGLFDSLCKLELDSQLAPNTIPYHAFNYYRVQGLYHSGTRIVIYPIGRTDILFHEYIHTRLSELSYDCLSEMVALEVTKKWKAEKALEMQQDFQLRAAMRDAIMRR